MTGAYSFVSKESSTDALCARLNAESGWQWRVGETPVPDLLCLVHLFESTANLRVVSFDGRECLIGDSFGQQCGRGSEQAVADADMVIEEGERLAGFDSLKPKTDATEFSGHWVGVHTIEAVSDDIAQGMLVIERGGLAFALRLGTHLSAMLGESVRRPHEEVAGANSRIADFEGQNGLLGFRG